MCACGVRGGLWYGVGGWCVVGVLSGDVWSGAMWYGYMGGACGVWGVVCGVVYVGGVWDVW